MTQELIIGKIIRKIADRLCVDYKTIDTTSNLSESLLFTPSDKDDFIELINETFDVSYYDLDIDISINDIAILLSEYLIENKTNNKTKNKETNITKLLKGKEGSKLYSTIHGNVILKTISSDSYYPIECYIPGFENDILLFTPTGKISTDSPEVHLFPSQNNKTWSILSF